MPPWERRGRCCQVYFLAISGGDGAFGAGLLCRRYGFGDDPDLQAGNRRQSRLRSMAPFTFLGGSYNNRLRTMYTTLTPSEIMTEHRLIASRRG